MGPTRLGSSTRSTDQRTIDAIDYFSNAPTLLSAFRRRCVKADAMMAVVGAGVEWLAGQAGVAGLIIWPVPHSLSLIGGAGRAYVPYNSINFS